MGGTGAGRSGLTAVELVALTAAIGVVLLFLLRSLQGSRPDLAGTRPRSTAAITAPIETAAASPTAFRGCPAEGAGGDPALNRLKNRVGEGEYAPLPIDSIRALGRPEWVVGRPRARWSAEARSAVLRLEERLVAVEGYLVGVRMSAPGSANCDRRDAPMRGWRFWVAPAGDRDRAVPAEATPRVRARHPAWTLARLREIERRQERVRIGGWLLLDEPSGRNDRRGEARWEIHPVLRLEVLRGGRWMPLDSLAAEG